jgi:hypothetical protein
VAENALHKGRARDFPAEELRENLESQSAFKLRSEGKTYGEIAKILGMRGGWTDAYKAVARSYGDAVAKQDKERMRLQEAGRMMYIRSQLEPRVLAGDKEAIDADIKYTAQIVEVLGLKDASEVAKAGGTAVQINIAPPWDRGGVGTDSDGPALTIEGEAVEEE